MIPALRDPNAVPVEADEARLLTAIAEAQFDMDNRLVYADWLQDRGDLRGELISIQVAIADLPENNPRRGDLAAREHDLMREFRPLVSRYFTRWPTFLRGFAVLASIKRKLGAYADAWNGLWRLCPTALRLKLTECEWRPLEELAGAGALERFHELALEPRRPGEGPASAFARMAHPRLRRLRLDRWDLRGQLPAILASSAGLEGLELVGVQLDGDDLDDLLAADLPELSSLGITGRDCPRWGARLVTLAERFPGIAHLRVQFEDDCNRGLQPFRARGARVELSYS